jgi:predicted permease
MLDRFVLPLRALFRRSEVERELDEELRFHLEREVEENIRRGMSPEEARHTAMLSFGGVDQIKEECRDVRGVRLWEDFWQDLRYGVRMLRKNPGFTFVIVLTIALGIGANTAVFSLTNALLLRAPQGVSRPEEIVQVGRTLNYSDFSTFSYPDYADVRDQNTSFTDLAAYRETGVDLTTGGAPELLSGMLVSGNYFRALETQAAVGRIFGPEDDSAPGANSVVVISHGFWQRRFASDPNVVGRVINLNNFPFTIVGVMQEGFTGTGINEVIDVWLPLPMYSQADPVFVEKRLEARQISWLNVLGRLKGGVTLQQAQADMTNLARRLEQTYSDTDKSLGIALVPELGLQPRARDEARTRMAILMGVAGLVLLIVCANVANLLLARGTVRRRELAVRQALGASRLKLMRQLLTEALLLSAIGGLLGVIVAFWSRNLLLGFDFLTGVRLSAADLHFDARVLGFALFVSLATGFVFGIVPAFETSNLELQSMLKDRSASGLQRSRFRGALVVGQIALSVVVLICSGLFVRTLRNTQSVHPGFDADRILLMPIDVGRRGYLEQQGSLFYQQLLRRVAAMPGVSAASLSVTAPLGGSWRTGFRVEGQPPSEPNIHCDYNLVAPRYFETAGIALIKGRDFTEQERANSPDVVIVNETFARSIFPHDDPLGKRLSIPRNKDDHSYSEIVGVVKDVKYERLTEPSRPYFYVPLLQRYQSVATLLVRSRDGSPSALAGGLAREVQALDKNLPVDRIRTLEERLRASFAPQRSATTLLTIFGVLALTLASVGLYGVLAYSVGQRQREIGIRMALGANTSQILKLIFGQGATLIIIGVVCGLLIAFIATRAITSMLFGISAADPTVYFTVSLILIETALVACYIPARRATKVDPLVALRYE